MVKKKFNKKNLFWIIPLVLILTTTLFFVANIYKTNTAFYCEMKDKNYDYGCLNDIAENACLSGGFTHKTLEKVSVRCSEGYQLPTILSDGTTAEEGIKYLGWSPSVWCYSSDRATRTRTLQDYEIEGCKI